MIRSVVPISQAEIAKKLLAVLQLSQVGRHWFVLGLLHAGVMVFLELHLLDFYITVNCLVLSRLAGGLAVHEDPPPGTLSGSL